MALPISVILVLLVSNDKDLMGEHTNGKVLNILTAIVFVITLFMSYRTFATTLPTIASWFA